MTAAQETPALSVEHVAVELGVRRVLEDVNLAARRGEVVGLIGPNGAGKTTLLRTVLGLLRPVAGRALVGGRPARPGSAEIGYVPQWHEFSWEYPLSVAGAVMTGLTGRLGLLRHLGANEWEAVADALDRVRMTALADRPVGQLSGGQRQRVLVARALALRPSLLLLDEPFTGLDMPAQEILGELFTQLARENRAVLMTTHDLASALYRCDRLALLNRTVIATGKPGRADRAPGGLDGRLRRRPRQSAAAHPESRVNMNPFDFFTDLFHPGLAFLPKALAVAVISSTVCGIVGVHVVLRGMAFIGDAVSHAVFPGLAIAFALSGDLVLGGVFAGVATAVLVAVFSQNRRLNESSIIGVLFVAAFALGVVVISQTPGYAGSLEQFLFGSITGIPDRDLSIAGIVGVAVLAAMFLLHKEFVAISLDRESARALGVPVFWLDLALYVLVTLAVVISVQTIGNILVLALLVTPAATARMLTDRLGVTMSLSPVIGGIGAFIGLYLSWSWDTPTGGTIVLVLTAAFLVAWFLSPRQGLLGEAVRGA
ncbi:ABC-type Mn2+/Zn2+ transport systems, permease [Leifsonia xyli subsp. cynodontis DSM 46306]|uniref:ABC transporter domain-containing protein n=1 Tax=Leifsonia xyli subsp. cynodontis DSM 46306 TaxID=1389489 RepID=U3P4D2_LEIXC|nr:anchored repeat-type ABC transporter permease subunit [Leifsonia xyli]AGW40621.1 ABC-type Mn2+/Zn2+ transport systems, permease [Leifsonia xyli subsp. cynodontis DSM 46306]